RAIARRDFLKLTGLGVLGLLAGRAAGPSAGLPQAAGAPGPRTISLAATDGFISLPGRADPLLVFGFIEVPNTMSIADQIRTYKGKVQMTAPTIAVDTGQEVYLKLSNLGFVTRPDLDDSHTVHWHGFRNPVSVFDGVPEASIAVPPGRVFPYFYRPRDAGTYMYHCHFEDVEHVQMGMNGIVYVRPALGAKFAYEHASTGFDREFALMLNEIDTRPHDNLLAIQEFLWTTYAPQYFIINGRAYPDTVKVNGHPDLPSQPISSLIQVNGGDRVLLRVANLGYQRHSLQLPGIRMRVVGKDATLLRRGATDLSYRTSTITLGPGEAVDVLFTAPAFDPGRASTDGRGVHNRYLLRSRDIRALRNPGRRGLGGMATEVRVYRDPLPPQTEANETYV
ncbi:MAG: multicopper oxidase domain-containing protein, partial [Actinomycetota bacterium]